MRYTAIALDYDGTIARDGLVPSRVMDGLNKLKASGRKLFLVTGRELNELLGLFRSIDVFDRVVAENGALLYNPTTGERRELGEPPPEALVRALQAARIPLAIGHTILATVRPHETTVLQCIADLGLEQQVIFNKGAVMVLPPGCNKASGLKVALAELGLSPRNLVAAGDGENDHALLELAEYSVATGNAVATLQEAADRVTEATHGDGVLEIVSGLLASDLRELPPRRSRRALALGTDTQGLPVLLPSFRSRLLIAGPPTETNSITVALMRQLSREGYQLCVVDRRGDYALFRPGVAFGTADNAPSTDEIMTALKTPDVQVIASLASLADEQAREITHQLLLLLQERQTRTGQPHWTVLNEPQSMLITETLAPVVADAANMLLISEAPQALSSDLLADVDVIASVGQNAERLIGETIAAAGGKHPAPPVRPLLKDEALVWFRDSPSSLLVVDTHWSEDTIKRSMG